MTLAGDPLALLRHDAIRPSLRGEVLRLGRGPHADFAHVVLIASGAAELRVDGAGHALPPGSVALVPARADATLALAAGSAGWLIGAAPPLLTEAVGQSAESAMLQALGAEVAVVRLGEERFAAEIEPLGRMVRREAGLGAQASPMAAAALLRLLLVAIWREGGAGDAPGPGHGSDLAVVQSFRRLVELRFAGHLPVTAYAGLLGLSYDRLHAVCARALGRSPLQLVHQRLLREAAMRLERSGAPIQAIAHDLGFSDATRFSHFFRRRTGLAPMVYRQRSRRGGQGRSRDGGQGGGPSGGQAGAATWAGAEPASFADWP